MGTRRPHNHLCDFCKKRPCEGYDTHVDYNGCGLASAIMYSADEIIEDCTEEESVILLKMKALIGELTYKDGIPVNNETGNDREYYMGDELVFKTEDNGGGYNIVLCEFFENDYPTYLKSDAWEKTKTERLKMDGYRCQMCGSAKNLCVHHITYKNLPNEKMGDLVTLCENCHRRVHTTDIVRKRGNK